MNKEENDCFTNTHTFEEQQLNTLRRLLERNSWSWGNNNQSVGGYAQALWILAGLDPEYSQESSEVINDETHWSFFFLPNGLSAYGLEQLPTSQGGWDDLEHLIFQQLGTLQAIPEIFLKSPKEIITHSLKHAHEIPWLEVAKQDPECAQYLPISIIEKNTKKKSSVDGKNLANTKWINDDGMKIRNGKGKEVFNNLSINKFKNYRFKKSGKINKTAIANIVLNEMEEFEPNVQHSLETVKNYVNKWLEELNR